MRAREGLPPLREQVLAREIARRIAQANASPRLRTVFRIVHFSIQDDHLHLVVEAADGALSRGVQGLAIRVARHVNALLKTRGSFWGDRFHAFELTSPRAVRNAIVYVLMNVKKHLRGWREHHRSMLVRAVVLFGGERTRLAGETIRYVARNDGFAASRRHSSERKAALAPLSDSQSSSCRARLSQSTAAIASPASRLSGNA